MKPRYFFCLLGLSVAVAACDKKTETPTTSEAAPTPAAAAPAAEEAEPAEAPAPAPAAAIAAPPSTDAAPATELPDPVAIVNGQPIPKAEFEAAIAEVFGSMGLSPSMLPPAQQAILYRQFVDDMVIDKLVEAASAQVEVSDGEVDAEIETIRAQYPSPDLFDQELASAGQTIDELKSRIARMLRQRKWMDSQLGETAAVSDADVQTFYQENQGEFEQPELVRASHILFLIDENADEAAIAEAKSKADAAAARAKKGEAFDELAKELSEEPGASDRGGDLNFFPKDRMVPEFADVAFAMDVDTISEPVRTQFGWHVIKVTDKKESRTVPLEEVNEQISQYLADAKKQEAENTVVETLRKDANVEIKIPEPPAPDAGAESPADQAGE